MKTACSASRLFLVVLFAVGCVLPLPAQNGKLKIKVKPAEAYVFVDGSAMSQAGHALTLSPGEHKIGLYNYGYKPVTQTVTISPNATANLDVTLEAIPDKVTGRTRYGIDTRRPGALVAVVARSEVLGGKPRRFDAARALALPGVRRVLEIPSGIAVLADSTWAALRGREALQIDWDPGPNAALTSAAIRRDFEAQSQGPGRAARREGDPESALASAARRIDAAVRALARSFSAELLPRRIRVNVMSPGMTETPIITRSGGIPGARG